MPNQHLISSLTRRFTLIGWKPTVLLLLLLLHSRRRIVRSARWQDARAVTTLKRCEPQGRNLSCAHPCIMCSAWQASSVDVRQTHTRAHAQPASQQPCVLVNQQKPYMSPSTWTLGGIVGVNVVLTERNIGILKSHLCAG